MKTIKNKQVFSVDDDLLAEFYDEITTILLYESDGEIADMWCELNCFHIPDKLKGVTVFMGLTDADKMPLDYWIVFNDIVKDIVPQQTLNKVHRKRLHVRNDFAYGKTYIYFSDNRDKTNDKVQ